MKFKRRFTLHVLEFYGIINKSNTLIQISVENQAGSHATENPDNHQGTVTKQSKGRAQESTAWNNGEELPQCKISQLASAWNRSKQERSEEQEVWAQTRRPSVVVEVVAWPGVRDYNRLRRPPNVHPYGEHMKWHHSDLLFTLLRADQWVRVYSKWGPVDANFLRCT